MEYYYIDLNDTISLLSSLKDKKYPDPEKWWSPEHTKIRVWEQMAIDRLLEELLKASPVKSPGDVIYEVYSDYNMKAQICTPHSESRAMYVYGMRTIYKISEEIEPDSLYYLELLNRYKEDYDYDDEW